MQVIVLPRDVRHASSLVSHRANPDAGRHALEVVVVPAAPDLAGADACDLLHISDVAGLLEERVASRVYAVPNGNRAGMTVVANVVRAINNLALGNEGNFDNHLVHGRTSLAG
jgi:hypothetical protein